MPENNQIIFDINIKSSDDLLNILIKNNYDFFVLEPKDEFVKIYFKKDSIIKEEKYIKYPIYTSIILSFKKISKLNLEETAQEQKGVGEYLVNQISYEVLSKTVPSNFGEILFVKIKQIEKKSGQEQAKKQKTMTAGKAFGFLGAMLFVVLVLGGVFLTFIVFNAKTPQDVSFFSNLGINLNDVNSFLLKLTTFIFSIFIVIQTIILIIFLFKAILTKKENKRKKTISTIVSIFMSIMIFASGTLWITLDKAIKNLPNWQEMSYGNIQIYDNDLIVSKGFDKKTALISDYTSIIGPINIKFDLKYLQTEEARKGFEIKKYTWDFGDGKPLESLSPNLIRKFDRKGVYKVKLTLEGIDIRFPNKISQKQISEVPNINISSVVNITKEKLPNGGTIIKFDASDLKNLGEIEWYTKDSLEKPVYIGEFYQPSKTFFDEEPIGIKIKNDTDDKTSMDRIFIVSGELSYISGEIISKVSDDNDLLYYFYVDKPKVDNGTIEKFKWIIDNKEIDKVSDKTDLESSSKVEYTFKNYGKQTIKVIIYDSTGKSREISKEVDIPKKISLQNNLEIYQRSGDSKEELLENVKFDPKTGEYMIYDLSAPLKLRFDSKKVRSENILFYLDEVIWDVGDDGSAESKTSDFEYEIPISGKYKVSATYKFVHRRNSSDIAYLKQVLYIDCVEKDVNLSLNFSKESDYAPTNVSFDASLSKIKNDNIVKFIYDYGDGFSEERDAINVGHRYLKEGNYNVKLTVVTEKGKEYSITKNLVIKPTPIEVVITTSMNTAPINQEIDFNSSESVGQISSYKWDFGDGFSSTEPNPSHSFKESGKYKVKLTLYFANNNVLSQEKEIEITGE